jgi:hypothetical protein
MEGRRHKRAHIQIGCWVVRQDGESCCCTTFDVSDTGISIATNSPLPVGQTVSLQLYTPHSASPLRLSAEVVWSSFTFNGAMGLKFIDISAEEIATLKELARQLAHRELSVKKLHGHG